MQERKFLCAFQPLLLASLGVAQEPPVSEFREWAKTHATPVAPVDELDRPDDLKSLARIVRDAQIIAFGEPIHGGPMEASRPWCGMSVGIERRHHAQLSNDFGGRLQIGALK